MSSIYIDTSQLTKGAERLQNMSKELEEAVDDVLTANTIEIEERAKQLAPRDRGFVAQHISADTSKHLRKEITVLAFYAAWLEFGTGAYAAAYVSTLPANWQAFAAQFRGERGKRTIAGILFLLHDWFSRHGIDKQHAFFIARKIFVEGTRAHPFLFPAYMQQIPQLERDLDAALKNIK